jgi:pimeloyl-ACP methyl ester carboxylesterase
VVRYDRAGLGDSRPGAGPRTAFCQARELAELLDRLAPPRPYLLVGHSAGAFVVRVFAAEHVREVAAIVLVDPATEDQRTRPAVDLVANLVLGALEWLARTPGLQQVVRAAVRVLAPRTGARVARRLRLLPVVFRPGHLRGTLLENRAFEESMAQVRHATSDHVPPGPSVRVVTVVATPGRPRRPAGPRKARHRDLVGGTDLRSDPSRVLAEGSGHLVPLDDPELVASVIERATLATP